MGTMPKADVSRLVETYRSYAHAIAHEVVRRMPQTVDKSDLLAAAELGLVEAASSFDPSRGVQFKTFAYYRIRGAVYDCLRKMGWFSKTLYDQYRFEMAANEFMKDYSTAPPPGGTPSEDYDEIKNVAGTVLSCYLLSLDSMGRDIENPGNSPEKQLEEAQQRQRVRDAVAKLPEKNRQVMEGYYYQELSLEQIGQRLGLSKSWVSRIHAKSLEMIRSFLEEAVPLRQETVPFPVR